MRKLSTLSSNYLRISLVMMVLTFAIFILFSFSVYRIQTMNEEYRSSLGMVNTVISEINRIRDEGPEIRGYSFLSEDIDKLLVQLPPWSEKELLEGNIRQLPERLEGSTTDFDTAVYESGSIARALSNQYYDHRNSLVFILFAGGTVTIFSIALLFTLTLILRQALHHFYVQIEQGLLLMQKTLDQERDNIKSPHEIKWDEERLLQETLQKLSKQIEQDQIMREMEPQHNLEHLLAKIFPIVDAKIPCDRLSIAFIEQHDTVLAEAGITKLDKLILEPGFTENLSQTSLGRVIHSQRPRIIHDLEQHYREVNKSISTRKLLEEGIRSSVTVPLMIEKRCVGFLFISSAQKHIYTEQHAYYARKISYTIKHHLFTSFILQQVIAESARGFVKLTEKKDNETSLHILRMSRYSYIIARQLRFSGAYDLAPSFMREMLWFSSLHDIGKIAVPDAILLKPGKLNSEEWAVMQSHVKMGEEVLRSMEKGISNTLERGILTTALDIISSHHEKWDGSGYPRGLVGASIPLAGRIVAVADVFDALTSKRPYKEAFSVEKALELIHENSGSHFDPKIVQAFDDAMDDIMEVYTRFKEV